MKKIERTVKYYREIFKHLDKNAYYFLIGNFFTGFGFAAFSLLFNLYLKSINIGESRIGNLLSTATFTTAILILPAAYIIKRTDIKKFFIISPLLTIIGYFIAVQFNTEILRYTGFILAGIGASFNSVLGGPFIMKISSDKTRTVLFSLSQATMLAAGITGNLLSGFLAGIIKRTGVLENIAFKYAIFTHLFFALISIYFFSKINVGKLYNQNFKDKITFNTSVKLLIFLILPPLTIGLGAGMTIPFLNLYFKTNFYLSSSTIGIIFAIAQFLTILGSLLSPIFAKKYGLINTIIATQLLSVPFLYILGFNSFFPLVLASFFLRNTLMNMASPLSNNFSLELVNREDRPLVSGLLSLAWLASWGLTANIGGHLIEHYGYRIPFLFTIFCYVLSSLLYFLLLKPLEKNIKTSE